MSATLVPPGNRTSGSRAPRWQLPPINATEAGRLAQEAHLPLIVAELLMARGIRNSQDAERFLHPAIEHLLDPYTMRGMRDAVTRVQAAIRRREPILIYGDYDVDGTIATVLLKTAIELLGGEARFHVPHRLREGYGMQPGVLQTAAQEGIRLVITVDTGIRDFPACEAARSLNLDLIITDHHLPDPVTGLPPALAVLNPNQPGCEYECKHLCGAGVAFKLAQALLEDHDAQYARSRILPSFLKLLAIATVADAVPLLGENRVFTAIGLDQLSRPVQAGLRTLMELAKLDPAQRKLTATDLAFRIAPRINAAGRMDIASEVVELFTTKQPQRARELAIKLDQLNQDRRNSEATILAEIEERLKDEDFRDASCVIIDGDGWHRGVIGILASRVVELRGRPAIVISNQDGESHGSGRSLPGFHLLDAIQSCQDLFTRFGGHAQAVGFSLPTERVKDLRARLVTYANSNLTDECLRGTIDCHAVLPLDRIHPALASWLRQMEPTGMGNQQPVFIARNIRVSALPRILKERHVRLQLAAGARSSNIPALGWNWAERIASLGVTEGSVIDLAYQVRENEHPEFGGLELEVVDLMLADQRP